MSNFNSDKLYILPCTQEKLAFGSFDNENKSGRPQLCFSNQKYKFAVNLGAKMDNRKKGKCVGDTDTSEICTWDNMLSYEGPQKKNCKPEEVWGYITSFVNKSNAEIDEKKQESTKNYFIVSHHNTLKKSILKDILTSDKKLSKKEKTHIANCTCFLLENENNIWHLTLIYDGFPDKDKYNYFQLSTSLSPQKLFPNETSHEGWNSLSSYLNEIQNKDKTRIFVIRHGNAFHNKPLQLTGIGINRNVDTNLTPLGIYQARTLGNFLVDNQYLTTPTDNNCNIFCASYMNRAQHTVLELVYALNNHTTTPEYKNLLNLEQFFTTMAISRLTRKYKDLNKAVTKLVDWQLENTPQRRRSLLKLMPNLSKQHLQNGDLKKKLESILEGPKNEYNSGNTSCRSFERVLTRPPRQILKREKGTRTLVGGKRKTRRRKGGASPAAPTPAPEESHNIPGGAPMPIHGFYLINNRVTITAEGEYQGLTGTVTALTCENKDYEVYVDYPVDSEVCFNENELEPELPDELHGGRRRRKKSRRKRKKRTRKRKNKKSKTKNKRRRGGRTKRSRRRRHS